MKRTKCLSVGLEQRLAAYVMASTAAGVGMLALAQSAAAEIVYTATKIPIPFNTGPVQFDLNHDGIIDFAFSAFRYTSRGVVGSSWLKILPYKSSNEIVDVTSKGHHCAVALQKGRNVGPKSRFHYDPASGLYMFFARNSGFVTSGCPWISVNGTAYLGLKFVFKGKTHYGWAGVDGQTLTGYAYETIAGNSIIAGRTKGPDVITGQAGSLGKLALGRK